MKTKKRWRHQSLETLENHYWGDPATAPTNLVKRCIELSKVPVDNFTLGLKFNDWTRIWFTVFNSTCNRKTSG
jgi:hypothetical protein